MSRPRERRCDYQNPPDTGNRCTNAAVVENINATLALCDQHGPLGEGWFDIVEAK